MTPGWVEIIDVSSGGPTTLLSYTGITDGSSKSLNQLGIAVQAGDTILFASRTANGALTENFTQIAATLTLNPPATGVPEPASLALAALGMSLLAVRRRCR